MKAAAVAVFVAMLVAAGCGGKESSAPVATTQVEMAKSYRFSPETIKVKAGSTVTWTNNDNFTHTVKVDDGPDHKIERGKSVTIRFPTAGTYKYVCTLHSQDMRGEVIVK
jgi:plastocyanin